MTLLVANAGHFQNSFPDVIRIWTCR